MTERRITVEPEPQEMRLNGKVPEGLYALEKEGRAPLQQIQGLRQADKGMKHFLHHLLLTAQADRTNAGYSGAHHDGGARALEEQIRVFIAGLSGTLPAAWDTHLKAFNREYDPEYATYQRLQKKFGDK